MYALKEDMPLKRKKSHAFRLNDATQGIDYDNFVHVTKISREENSLKNLQVFDLTLWGTIVSTQVFLRRIK
jgi:hypothetical protein